MTQLNLFLELRAQLVFSSIFWLKVLARWKSDKQAPNNNYIIYYYFCQKLFDNNSLFPLYLSAWNWVIIPFFPTLHFHIFFLSHNKVNDQSFLIHQRALLPSRCSDIVKGWFGQRQHIQGTLCPRSAISKKFRSGTHWSRTNLYCTGVSTQIRRQQSNWALPYMKLFTYLPLSCFFFSLCSGY
jgi:hypothetical protein